MVSKASEVVNKVSEARKVTIGIPVARKETNGPAVRRTHLVATAELPPTILLLALVVRVSSAGVNLVPVLAPVVTGMTTTREPKVKEDSRPWAID